MSQPRPVTYPPPELAALCRIEDLLKTIRNCVVTLTLLACLWMAFAVLGGFLAAAGSATTGPPAHARPASSP